VVGFCDGELKKGIFRDGGLKRGSLGRERTCKFAALCGTLLLLQGHESMIIDLTKNYYRRST
jgi:hypothetical protein